jgi:hypothetical protein
LKTNKYKLLCSTHQTNAINFTGISEHQHQLKVEIEDQRRLEVEREEMECNNAIGNDEMMETNNAY